MDVSILKKSIHEKVELLAYFKPKQRKGVCVTLREWAAIIFKCEFEPQTLDASSKDILKSTLLKKKKYKMKDNDLNWAQVHKEEEKNSKEKTPINLSLMKDKDLYLIVCEALKTGGSNTKNNCKKKINAEAVKSMVEMVERKWDCSCENIKEAIKFLTADKESKDDKDDRDHLEDNFFFSSSGTSDSDGSSSSTDNNSNSSNDSDGTDSYKSDDENDGDKEEEDDDKGDYEESEEEEQENNRGKSDNDKLSNKLEKKGQEEGDDHSNDE